MLLGTTGSTIASHTASVAHGATYAVSTQDSPVYVEVFTFTNPLIQEGAVNIESTNSGVFCTARTSSVGSITAGPSYTIPLVRVNPHPGTVE